MNTQRKQILLATAMLFGVFAIQARYEKTLVADDATQNLKSHGGVEDDDAKGSPSDTARQAPLSGRRGTPPARLR